MSKKVATQARRCMKEHWRFPENDNSAQERNSASKIARGQLGPDVNQMWITDIVKTCKAKVLYVSDFAHGVAEVQKAALRCKTSLAANQVGVRVWSWATDPRRVFADLGTARIKTQVGELYLAGKLTLVGHTVVEDPGPKPERARKLLKAALPAL